MNTPQQQSRQRLFQTLSQREKELRIRQDTFIETMLSNNDLSFLAYGKDGVIIYQYLSVNLFISVNIDSIVTRAIKQEIEYLDTELIKLHRFLHLLTKHYGIFKVDPASADQQ